MSYNEGGYYGPQTSGPTWEPPCYTGPPQNQGPQFSPQNQNTPNHNQTFPSQNECPQFVPQNQGALYSPNSFPHQNQVQFGSTQHQRHPCSTQNSQCDQFLPQNPGPQLGPHNNGPMCTPQNQGPHFPNQGNPVNQAPSSQPQHQDSHYPTHHQGACFQTHNSRPCFPPEHQCASQFPPHNSGPRFPPLNSGPRFPPQTHGRLFPPRNQGPQSQNVCPSRSQHPLLAPQNYVPQFRPRNLVPHGPSQNQGPHYTAFNQGAPLPTQNQRPMGPPQNHGPQLSPTSQQQNQIPCCCPTLNQGPQYPPLSQGPSYQGPPAPIQSQNSLCPPTPGPQVPSQNLRPSLLPQNQLPICPPPTNGPMCPPQNHRPLCPPQNQLLTCPSQERPPFYPHQHQRPGFPPRYQGPNNGPGFSPNNAQFYGPHNQGPRFPQPSGAGHQPDKGFENQFEADDWNNQDDEYTDDFRNQCEEYGDDWDNQNDCEDWNNKKEYCEEDWKIQPRNHKWKSTFRQSIPSKRGRGRGFIEKDFKEPPLKRQRGGPNTSAYKGTANIKTSIKQCSNNIQINFVKISETPTNLNVQDSLLNESEQRHLLTKKDILQNFEKCNVQKNITKADRSSTVMKSNVNLFKIRDEDAHRKADNKVVNKLQEKNQEPKTMALKQCLEPKSKLVESISSSRDKYNKNTIKSSSSKNLLNKEKIFNKESEDKAFKVIDYPLPNSSLSELTEKTSNENLALENKTVLCTKSNQRNNNSKACPKIVHNQDTSIQNCNKLQQNLLHNTHTNNSLSNLTQKLSSDNLVLEDKAGHCNSNVHEFVVGLNSIIVQNQEKSPQNLNNHQESEQVILNTTVNSLNSNPTQELSTEQLVLENKGDHLNSNQNEFGIRFNPKIVHNQEKSTENLNNHQKEQFILNTSTDSSLPDSIQNLSTENLVLEAKGTTYLCTLFNQCKSNFKSSPKIVKNEQETALKSKESDNKDIKNIPAKRSNKEGYDSVKELKNLHTSKITHGVLQNSEELCLESNYEKDKEKKSQNTPNCAILKNQEESKNISKVSPETSCLQREELRRSKRLNPQSGNVPPNSPKNLSCDKPSNPKETTLPILITADSIKSESEVQIQIEDVHIKSEIIINNAADISCESTETPGSRKGSTVNNVKSYLYETVNIKTEKENITDPSSSGTTVPMNNFASQEKSEPDCAANMASNERSPGNTIGASNEVALENSSIASSEDNTVGKCTNSSDNPLIVSDRPSPEDLPNDESQNCDMQTVYQPPNEDSQNSSCLSRDDVNLREANLREFDILDEVEGSDGDGDQSTISNEESDSDVSDQEAPDIDEEDIDAMLEEGLDINKEAAENKVTKKIRHKVILEEIGHNHFDLLPEGWIQVMHNSGMPVYLHQKSRVCSMTRPYFLGPGSVRSHKIPLSSIPCLQYKRALEVEKKYEEENKAKQAIVSENSSDNPPPLLPVISAKIETAEENEAAQSLESSELMEYCKKVFNFKTISIIPFKTWGNRRRYGRITKDVKKQERPLLPKGTKLLKFPIQNPDGTLAKSKGEWVINPNGKSYVCILHEYVQQALKQHPKYQFKELKNPSTPYSATVFIGEMQYGTGIGGSKKYAKLEAAKAALEVLIPEMKDKLENENEFGINSGISKKRQDYENSIFDQIRIEDPRVAEFCAKTTEPAPYAILATCLQRNGMGLNEVKVEYNMNTKRHKEDEYKMTVKNHTATVMCKNKREGKQKAAQAILKALHPNIEHFGSLLRMYGNHSIKSVKEKKREEQEITGLQCKAAVNQPNFAILNKLEAEMIKLVSRKREQLAKGKFHFHTNLLLPTASTADLKKINL